MTTTSDPSASSASSPDPEPRRRGGGLRVFKWIVLILLLIVIVGGVALYMNINRIVRSTVQKKSSSSLNLPTELQSANVSLFTGEVSLNQFNVGSPGGFNAPHMMTLGGVDVKTSLGQLRSDPVRVSSIEIK